MDGFDFPIKIRRNQAIKCRITRKRCTTVGPKISILGRELLSNEWISQSALSSTLELPSWKISRMVKGLEIGGFVECVSEDRHIRGQPQRFCRLTQTGVSRFSAPVMNDGGEENE
jgi:predicted ArsR family transcriptional regulator